MMLEATEPPTPLAAASGLTSKSRREGLAGLTSGVSLCQVTVPWGVGARLEHRARWEEGAAWLEGNLSQ